MVAPEKLTDTLSLGTPFLYPGNSMMTSSASSGIPAALSRELQSGYLTPILVWLFLKASGGLNYVL